MNIMRLSLFLIVVFVIGCAKKSEENNTNGNAQMNVLSETEQAEGWILLFDGKTLNGWKQYGTDSMSNVWSVKEHTIVCAPQPTHDSTVRNARSLMTVDTFGNFELRFEWKLSSGGNSGVLYHVVEKPGLHKDYESGPEYQLLDDSGWKGEELKPAQLCGSAYDMYPAKSEKKLRPANEWNSGKIIYNEGKVAHWLNDELVVSFDEKDPDFQARFQKSKWVDYPQWNKFKSGSISLQEHGDGVAFRNLKIKRLD